MNRLIVLLLSCLFLCIACNDSEKAQTYYFRMHSLQQQVVVQALEFNSVLNSRDSVSIYTQYDALKDKAKMMFIKAQETEAFDGDSTLKIATRDLLMFYMQTLNQEYPTLIRYQLNGYWDSMAVLQERITQQERIYDQKAFKTAETFARQHGFLIQEE
jgi:hypothetical protein